MKADRPTVSIHNAELYIHTLGKGVDGVLDTCVTEGREDLGLQRSIPSKTKSKGSLRGRNNHITLRGVGRAVVGCVTDDCSEGIAAIHGGGTANR